MDLTASTAPDPSSFGEPVTFTAAVTSPQGATVANGTVEFRVDGNIVDTVALGPGGAASYTTSTLPGTGTYQISASFAETNRFETSTEQVSHTVNPAGTDVAVTTVEHDPSVPNQPFQLTAQVTAVGDAAPDPSAGTLRFTYDGADHDVSLGTGGEATHTVTGLTQLGGHDIDITFIPDDANHATSTLTYGHIVADAASVAVTPPTSATAVGAPADFAVVVTAPSGTPQGTVVLIDGADALVEAQLDASGSATLSTPALEAGTHNLTVEFQSSDRLHAAGSAQTQHTVDPGTAPITVTPGLAVSVVGDDVAIVANLDATGTPHVMPTGTVRFFVDDTQIAAATVDELNARAVHVTSFTTTGEKVLHAVYDGDANYPSATSPDVEHLVVSQDLDLDRTVTPTTGTSGEISVDLAATGTNPPGTTYEWDLGDGRTLTGPSHTGIGYDDPGIYTVTLRTSLDHGSIGDPAVQTAATSNQVSVAANVPPTAVGGDDRVTTAGTPVTFDGSSSLPRYGIDSWSWDFGDGTTSSAQVATKTYTQPGTYPVSLTTTNGNGAHTTHLTVTVVSTERQADTLTIDVTASGALLDGATVVVENHAEGRYKATAVGGTATLRGLRDGTYTVYAWGPGYLPSEGVATVTDGAGTATIDLPIGNVTVTDVRVRTIDNMQELVALGVDVSNPANNVIEFYEANLKFGDETVKVRAGTNENGDDAGVNCGCGGGGGGGLGTPGGPGGVPRDGKVLIHKGRVFWMIVPARASWLKQFFSVELVALNAASPSFTLAESLAVLDLPAGLSLADTAMPQTRAVDMGNIAGGQAAVASWVVRGDAPGDYTLGADFSARLDPIGESVHALATSNEITVRGAEATSVVVHTDDKATIYQRQHFPYLAQVGLRNDADIAIHNVSLAIRDEARDDFVFQPRQPTLAGAASLPPGETLWLDVIAAPKYGDYLDLGESFIASPRGETSPDSHGAPDHLNETPRLHDAGTSANDPRQTNDDGCHNLSWEPAAGAATYELYSTPSFHTPFPDQPIATFPASGQDWTDICELDAGAAGIYALRTVMTDGTAAMHHNVLVAKAGTPSDVPEEESHGEDDDDKEYVEDPVNTATGNLTDTTVDLTFNDATYAMSFARTYNSQSAATGDLSMGWSSSFSQEVIPGASGEIVLVEPDGATRRFEQAPDGTYRNPRTPTEIVEHPNGSFTAHVGDSETWDFTPEGRLTTMADGIGQSVDMAYDAQGHLDTATSSTGFAFDFTHDPSTGQLASVQSSDGRSVDFAYDTTTGALNAVTGADGHTNERYGHDAFGRVNAKVDNSGDPVMQLSYDASGRVRTMDTPNGDFVRFDFDAVAHTTVVTNTASGDVTGFQYSPDLQLESITDPTGATTWRTWTPEGRLVGAGNRGGGVSGYGYDDEDRVIARHMPDGTTVTLELDELGRTISQTTPGGGLITVDYTGTSHLPSAVTTPANGTTTYTFNDGQITSITPEGQATASFGYTAERLLAWGEVDGQRTSYSYDAAGRTTSVTRPNNTTESIAYDSAGRPETVTDPGGATTTLAWNEKGRVASLTNAAGGTTSYTYNDAGQILTVTDPSGRTTTNTFDESGDLIRLVDGAGNVTRFTYGPLARIETVTDPEGQVIQYCYDVDGNVTAEISGLAAETNCGSPAAGAIVERMTYDRAGRLTSEVSAEGVRTEYGYADGLLVSRTDAAGTPEAATTTYTYNDGGQLTAVRSPAPNGAGGYIEETYTYTPSGQLHTTTRPSPNHPYWTDQPVHGVGGLAWSETVTTTNVYDSRGQLIEVHGPLSATEGPTTYAYDEMGRVIRTTSPGGRVSETDYDAAGRVTEQRSSVGDGQIAAKRYAYDAFGRLSGESSAADTGWITYGRDGNGRVTSVTDPNGAVATYAYDAMGNQIRRDAGGTTKHWAYDGVGRVVAEWVGPNAQRSDYSYTNPVTGVVDGRLHQRSDGSGRVETISYGPGHRVASRTHTNGAEIFNYAYAYDGAGRLTTITDSRRPATPMIQEWDDAGNLVRRWPEGTSGPTQEWSYGASGNVTARHHRAEEYVYDLNGRLATSYSSEDPWRLQLGDWDRDPDGYVTERTGFEFHWDSQPIEYWGRQVTLDDAGRISSVYDYRPDIVTGDLVRQLDATFGRDLAGRITTESAQMQLPNSVAYNDLDYNRAYSYDTAGQLRSVIDTDTSATVESYDYGPGGRRASRSVPAGTDTYTWDSSNGQLSSVAHADGTTTAYTYDGAGRRTQAVRDGATTTYTYDAEGRLTQRGFLDSPGADPWTESRTYNVAGELASIELNDTVTTNSANLAWDPVGTMTHLESYTHWAHGDIGLAAGPGGAPWADSEIGVWAQDAHGSNVEVFEWATSGLVVAGFDYEAYGTLAGGAVIEPPNMNAPVAVGYRNEIATTGLIHLRNRDYEPSTGVFLTPDPLEGVDGTPTVASPYHYADNDPVNGIDPLGLCRMRDEQYVHQENKASCDDARAKYKRDNDTTQGAHGCWWNSGETFYLWDPYNSVIINDDYTCRTILGNGWELIQWWEVSYREKGQLGCLRWDAWNCDLAESFAVLRDFIPFIDCYRAANGGDTEDFIFCATEFLPIDEGMVALRRIARSGDEGADAAADALRRLEELEETRHADDAATISCVAHSFGADTRVLMANGERRAIADVEVGDEVLATDPETGETGAREVIATLPHTDQLLTLRTSSGEIVTTEDHRYWNATDHQWQESQHLDAGDRLLTADGDQGTVEGLDWTTLHTGAAYDLDIADLDSFYVGAGDESVLVHNADRCQIAARQIQAEHGGDIYRVGNADAPGGTPPLNPSNPHPGANSDRWVYHEFVVDEHGLVRDEWVTDMPLEEYLREYFPGWSADDLDLVARGS